MPAPVSTSLTQRIEAISTWRDYYNPVAGLTLPAARALLESYNIGQFADLMWTFGAPMTGIENADPDLLALIERRTSAVLEMDWDIRTSVPQKDEAGQVIRPASWDATLADDQAAALRDQYEGIDNLHDAIEHLCLATFRGFSHLEPYTNADGDCTHLECVDQWNIVRNGMKGDWKYNPTAAQTSFTALGADLLIDPALWVIREVRRPVNRIALVKFIRASLCDKDWDAFSEIYNVPSGVVIMPANVPPEKEAEYMEAARRIAQGGSGALPNGATYTPNDQPRGVSPFRARLDYLSEKLILAGTGGLLTMLAASGTGTLAGGAHSDTFDQIARKEAAAISALFQRQLDRPLLERLFPGRPVLARFELAANEEVDSSAYIKDLGTLATAGYLADPEEVTEKTGIHVTVKPAPAVAPGGFGAAQPVPVDPATDPEPDPEDPEDPAAPELKPKEANA